MAVLGLVLRGCRGGRGSPCGRRFVTVSFLFWSSRGLTLRCLSGGHDGLFGNRGLRPVTGKRVDVGYYESVDWVDSYFL